MFIILFIIIPLIFFIAQDITCLETSYIFLFGGYFITALILLKKNKPIHSKILKFLLFFIMPLFFIGYIITDTKTWYDDLYLKTKGQTTVYLYNESSAEEISACYVNEYKNGKSLLDKLYESCWFLPKNFLYGITESHEISKLDIRSDATEIELSTRNCNTKKDYIITLEVPSISESTSDVYLCYGGKSLFQFYPTENEKKEIKNVAKKLDKKWNKVISKPENAIQSIKSER